MSDATYFLGDAREESELLTWILYQMKEDTIENINRDLLMKMIGDYDYLAVFFCKFKRFLFFSYRIWPTFTKFEQFFFISIIFGLLFFQFQLFGMYVI